VKVEQVDEFELKGIRRPLAAYNVLASKDAKLKRTDRNEIGDWHKRTCRGHRRCPLF
jgi:hypothetical protein